MVAGDGHLEMRGSLDCERCDKGSMVLNLFTNCLEMKNDDESKRTVSLSAKYFLQKRVRNLT
jgi:hypothetical protein